MANDWSDAVKRLIGYELMPCPICGGTPDITCCGSFADHDLYSVDCYHAGNPDYYPITTPLSSELSDCMRMWNNIVRDYQRSMINFDSFIKHEIKLANQEENLHESFTEFLRSD